MKRCLIPGLGQGRNKPDVEPLVGGKNVLPELTGCVPKMEASLKGLPLAEIEPILGTKQERRA